MFRARDEVEERVRETREAWQGSQAEMIKTVSGLQGTGPALHSTTLTLLHCIAFLFSNKYCKLSVRPGCPLQTN